MYYYENLSIIYFSLFMQYLSPYTYPLRITQQLRVLKTKNKKKPKKPKQTLSALFNKLYKGTFNDSISKHDLQKRPWK